MERLTKRGLPISAAFALAFALAALAHAPGASASAPKVLAGGSAKVSPKICNIDWEQGPSKVQQLIRCAAHRWPVPGGAPKALDVARCESGFNPTAYSGYSGGNAGVFQQNVVYWPGRAATYGFPGWSPFNGRANVIVSIRMAHAGGWSSWSCA